MAEFTRSFPYLRAGFVLMCGAVLIWLLIGMYRVAGATQVTEFSGGGHDIGERVGGMMRLSMLAYGVAAVSFLGGVVLTVMGLIQFSHMCRANLMASSDRSGY